MATKNEKKNDILGLINTMAPELSAKLNDRLIDATFKDLIAAICFGKNYDFMPSKDEIMSTQEFAEYMGTSKRTLDRIVEHNELKEIRFRCGGQWRWNARGAWNPSVLSKINEYTL